MSDRGCVVETQDLTGSNALTASVAGTSYKATRYTEAVGYLLVDTMTGTAPTIAAKFQTSPDGSDWVDHPGGYFTQVIASDTNVACPITCIGAYVRLYFTVGGTSPSIPCKAKIAFKT
jgi:hypothetical protein